MVTGDRIFAIEIGNEAVDQRIGADPIMANPMAIPRDPIRCEITANET